MPIPARHLKQLKAQLRHHEVIIRFGTNRKLLGAIAELCDNPDLRKQISKNPGGYFKQKRIALPRGSKVSFREYCQDGK
jgi:hypothetical protein